ncbi:MAG: hypothetical protein COA78_21695 [Blastopirellula sp.]|nr:MAG: hypothetical protein COA78_21695 [Blastopirellula sp.]
MSVLLTSVSYGQSAPGEKEPTLSKSQQEAVDKIQKIMKNKYSGNPIKSKEGDVYSVYLSRSEVTDADLEQLKAFPGLKTLSLEDTKISDAGLIHLKGLKQLEILRLNRALISDEGLVHIKGLSNLRWLLLNDTQVTIDGLQMLKAALPNCRISLGFRRVPISYTTYAIKFLAVARTLILENVRTEIELTEEQALEIDTLLIAWAKNETDVVRRSLNRNLIEDQREPYPSSLVVTNETSKKVMEILTEDQKLRLDQLKFQKQGLLHKYIYISREESAQLKLTAAQRGEFEDIFIRWENRYGRPRKGTQAAARLDEKMLEVFSEEQLIAWNQLHGKLFDFDKPAPGERRRTLGFTYPNLGMPVAWLKKEWVTNEMKVTDDQLVSINELRDNWQKLRDEITKGMRSRPQLKELDKLRQNMRNLSGQAIDITDQITAVLTADQNTRLDQIMIQSRGVMAFREPTNLRFLELNSSQKRDLQRVVSKSSNSHLDYQNNKMDEFMKVLTEQQKKKWIAKRGELIDFPVKDKPTQPEPSPSVDR